MTWEVTDLGRSLRTSKDERMSITRPVDVANTVPVASGAVSLLNCCDVNVRRESCQHSLVALKHFIQWSFLVTVYETGEVANLAFEFPFTG
jgi:hypothetical protein